MKFKQTKLDRKVLNPENKGTEAAKHECMVTWGLNESGTDWKRRSVEETIKITKIIRKVTDIESEWQHICNVNSLMWISYRKVVNS